MPSSSQYNDAAPTSARQVWELLRANLEGKTPFKAFFYGDPILIPQSLLPCIVVDTVNDANELGPTQFDDVTTAVMIKVIFNKKDDFNAEPNEALTKQKVEYYMGGRDKVTKEYKPDTVKGVLRKNITLNDDSSNFSSSVDYDVIIRPEDQLTEEAQMTITVNSLVQVSSRT